MSKVSHHEAKYGCGDDEKHCSNCTMYRAATESAPHCTKVVDPIEPYGVCKFWYPKAK